MRKPLAILGLTMAAFLASSRRALLWRRGRREAGVTRGQPENIVLQKNAAALQTVRGSSLGPPMVARALAIVHTCMPDARAAYERVAVGPR
jgi:hypothetical protein